MKPLRKVTIFEAAVRGVRLVGPGITHVPGCELYYEARGWRRPWVMAFCAKRLIEVAGANEIVLLLATSMRRRRR